MAMPVFGLYDYFKVREYKSEDEFVTILSLTKLNPKKTKEVKKRYLLSQKGHEVQDIFGIEECFEVEWEILDTGEDEGVDLLQSKEDAQGDDAKLEYEMIDRGIKRSGILVCDVTTQGGAANDIYMGTGTLYVYGKPTKEVVSE